MHIETTAGTHESMIHALLLTEAGVQRCSGDVAYAEPRRRVTPTGQYVHRFLEVVPLMAPAFLNVLHWDQARALVGASKDRPEFAVYGKRHPPGRPYVVGLLGAILICGVIPYAEEFWRCYRLDRTLAARAAQLRAAA